MEVSRQPVAGKLYYDLIDPILTQNNPLAVFSDAKCFVQDGGLFSQTLRDAQENQTKRAIRARSELRLTIAIAAIRYACGRLPTGIGGQDVRGLDDKIEQRFQHCIP